MQPTRKLHIWNGLNLEAVYNWKIFDYVDEIMVFIYAGNSFNKVATKSQGILALGVCKNKYSFAFETVQIWIKSTQKIFFGANLSILSKLNLNK